MGTLGTWKRLQREHRCFFLVADLHVLTTECDHPHRIRGSIVSVVKDWLGAGLDPELSPFILQSAIPQHAELAVLLSMLVTVARAARNPTYKEQVRQLGLSPSLGLLSYPVLQAADILLYKGEAVPVGQDQLPHLELARELARTFNRNYGKTFPEPEPLLSDTPRLVGTDGRTMHTSYGNTIPLATPPEDIQRQILAMVTDPARVRPTDPGHPEVCVAFEYRRAFDRGGVGETEDACRRGEVGCVDCKRRLATILVQQLAPFRQANRRWHEDDVWEILQDGTQRARSTAEATLSEVRGKMGLTGNGQFRPPRGHHSAPQP